MSVRAQISSSRCQSALFRASRDTSRPSTIPAWPMPTSATRRWNPSRSIGRGPGLALVGVDGDDLRRPASPARSPVAAARTAGSRTRCWSAPAAAWTAAHTGRRSGSGARSSPSRPGEPSRRSPRLTRRPGAPAPSPASACTRPIRGTVRRQRVGRRVGPVGAGAADTARQATQPGRDAAVLQHRQPAAATRPGHRTGHGGAAAHTVPRRPLGSSRWHGHLRRRFWGAPPGPAPAPPSGDAPAPRTGRRSGGQIGRAAGTGSPRPGLPGERHHLVGQLVRPPRPGPGRHQTGQAGRVHRGGRLIERRTGEPERGGRPAHRLPVHPDLPHHLVLDLHQIPRIEELRRRERGIADLDPVAGSDSAPPATPPPSGHPAASPPHPPTESQ